MDEQGLVGGIAIVRWNRDSKEWKAWVLPANLGNPPDAKGTAESLSEAMEQAKKKLNIRS